MGTIYADTGLKKLRCSGPSGGERSWVLSMTAGGTKNAQLVTDEEAASLITSAGGQDWASTADETIDFWTSLSMQEKKALEDDCEAQQQ